MNEEQLLEMSTQFRSVGQTCLSMSHYELNAVLPDFSAEQWKMFLMMPEISDWINSELAILQNSELNKLIQNVSKSNSVGRAQLINSLNKMQETAGNKEGPAFIYTYVPLDTQQQHAQNVRHETTDIFLT